MTGLRDSRSGAGVDSEAAGTADPVEDPNDTGASIEAGEVYHLLRNERRRRTLQYLLAVDEEPVKMRDVAEAVAAAEYDTTVEALPSDQRQRVYITLYQSHLPQMADRGIIEYDKDRGLITTTPRIEAVEPYVDPDDGPKQDVPGWLSAIVAGFGFGSVTTLAAVQGLGAVGTLGAAVLVVLVVLGVVMWRPSFGAGLPSWIHGPVGDR